jgi:hypothetical protein
MGPGTSPYSDKAHSGGLYPKLKKLMIFFLFFFSINFFDAASIVNTPRVLNGEKKFRTSWYI